MKILFALSSPEYLRFYDQTLLELAQRGHDVVVAVSAVRDGKPVRLSALQGLDPRISVVGVIPGRDDLWVALARSLRGTMDFVRYLHPALADAHALRARLYRKALPWSFRWFNWVHRLEPSTVARFMSWLARGERGIPVSSRLVAFLDRFRPDVLLVSPLIEMASEQVDLVRAAQASGVRVATLVASWDNLTNKGDLRVPTDRIFVWNEAQKREAVTLHRVDPATVVATGAQVFDRWFDRRPSLEREVFRRAVGLPDARPFVLYTGSSIFIARAEFEMPFVRRWIEALRACDDRAIRDMHVLVRPHPYNGQSWNPNVFSDLPGVAVWPRGGYDPVDEQNRAGFFDSMFHAEAIVGINTSAMIEAAIVGRPVLSITPAQFAGTQGDTLHFHHLLPENGGFVRVAADLETHVAQLGGLLRDPDATRAELRRFVSTFIRPLGIEHAATPLLANAIEEFGRDAPRPPLAASTGDRLLGVLLVPAAILAPLFPPEGWRRHPVRLSLLEAESFVKWLWHDLLKRLARAPVLVQRRGRKLAYEARRAASLRYQRLRRARHRARVYIAGAMRRFRDVP